MSYVTLAPDEEHVAPAAPYVALAPVVKYITPGLSHAAPAPVEEFNVPVPAVSHHAHAPVDEWVMRASVARLGYEWRRTRRREAPGGDFAASQSRVAGMPLSWAYGDVAGVAGGKQRSDPAPSAIAGVVTPVGNLERSVEFHEQAILELERQASVMERLETTEEVEQRMVQLQQLS